MTPDEQAKNLIDKYQKISGIIHFEAIKKCALISVEEIENALIECGELSDQLQNMDRELNFWQNVRKAIESL
jgi:hypothetical protein